MNQWRIGALALALLVLCGCGYGCNRIGIGKYRWLYHGANNSSLTNRWGAAILPVGEIALWGKYPYLWGQIYRHGAGRFFVIDCRTDAVSYVAGFDEFSQKNGVEVRLENLVTFQDLHGQWEKTDKLKFLQEEFHHVE